MRLNRFSVIFVLPFSALAWLSFSTHGAVAQVPAASSVSDFSGVWLRDEQASDDVEEKLEEAFARSGQGVRLGGSTPFGGFGNRNRNRNPNAQRRGPGQGRSGGAGAQGGGMRDRLEHMARGLQVLQIEQTDGQVSLKNAHRETRVFLVDGRVVGDGFGSQTVASLDRDRLLVETQAERSQIVETFQLAGDGRQMVLTTDVQGGRGVLGDFQFRTVFELVEGTREARQESRDAEETRDAVPDAPPGVAVAQSDPTGAPVSRARVVGRARESSSPTAAPPDRLATVDEILEDENRLPASDVIRLLPPLRAGNELLTGRTRIQTLPISPAVEIVEFFVDDERVAKKSLPPYEAKVPLADPPREQIVRVSAYSASGRHLGDDERVVNRIDPPFRVRLSGLEGDSQTAGEVTALADVSVPRGVELEALTFYYGDRLVSELSEAPFRARVATPDVTPQSYVRVVARLNDGRELEDVKLLIGADFSEVVDVHLVQLQVLATDKRGTPLAGLTAQDFEVTHGGKSRALQRVYPSQDVPLLLGLSIDSSGSMAPVWPQTRRASERFLDRTLTSRDKAFLVDFDSQLRLLQPVTGDREKLFRALGRLQPRGGTALYDSVLFSMLQYDEHPGRRALIVITDGFDSASKADPQRAIEFGRRLGVPVYVIAMTSRGGASGGGFGNQRALAEGAMKGQMKLITEPTGGRMFQALNAEQVVRAFDQIQDELRQQYILTFYTDQLPEPGDDLKVKVLKKGARVKTALPLDLAQ